MSDERHSWHVWRFARHRREILQEIEGLEMKALGADDDFE